MNINGFSHQILHLQFVLKKKREKSLSSNLCFANIAYRPSTKMKNLHWTKLTIQSDEDFQSSIWASNEVRVDIEQIEALFCTKRSI
jgi:hypothetical protein